MRLRAYLAVALIVVFGLSASLAGAATITGGNDVINRTTRDGAYEITFIDLTHRVSGDGWLTKWSFYADYTISYVYNPDPKQVKLKIFRENGLDYDLIWQSDMVTVSEWERAYFFDIPNIPVKEGDIIGWYYPTQGSPGGVISYQSGTGTDTRWTTWPDPLGEITGSVPKSRFSQGGEGRLYSISVEGTTVPVPATFILLGSGLGWLAVKRRRMTP